MDSQKYNGRVNIIQSPNPNIQFQMHEKIALKNKSTSYYDAVVGIQEHSLLSQTYFSAENMQIIQNGLRAGVYEMSKGKITVPPQNVDALKTIMRSIFLQYSEHCGESRIAQEVEKLNKLVLDYAVLSVYNEAVGYLKYCQDQSSLVVPIERAQHTDRVYKQLELKPWF